MEYERPVILKSPPSNSGQQQGNVSQIAIQRPKIRGLNVDTFGDRTYVFEAHPGVYESIRPTKCNPNPECKKEIVRVKDRCSVWPNAFLVGERGAVFHEKPLVLRKDECENDAEFKHRKLFLTRSPSSMAKYLLGHAPK